MSARRLTKDILEMLPRSPSCALEDEIYSDLADDDWRISPEKLRAALEKLVQRGQVERTAEGWARLPA